MSTLQGAMTRIERPHDAQGILLFRYPMERIPSGARLAVAGDECAVLTSHGKVLGLLPPGTHALTPREHRFLEPAVDLVSDGSELSLEIYLILTGAFSGVPIQGSLGKVTDESGRDVPVYVTAELSLQVEDPEKLTTALLSRRDDPMESVKFVAVRGLRATLEQLVKRGDIVPATVAREGGKLKRAAETQGLGLREIGVALLALERVELAREPPKPTAPAPGPGAPGPMGMPPGMLPSGVMPGGMVPGMTPQGGAVLAGAGVTAAAVELPWSIPAIPHADLATGLVATVTFNGAFVGTPVPPTHVQWLVDSIAEALFTIARDYSGNVLEIPAHLPELSQILLEFVAPRLHQAGLVGQIVVRQVELSPQDPQNVEILRRLGYA